MKGFIGGLYFQTVGESVTALSSSHATSPNGEPISGPGFRAFPQRNRMLPKTVLRYKERFSLKISKRKVSVKDNMVRIYALASLLNPSEGQVLCTGHGDSSKTELQRHAGQAERLMSE